MVVEDLTSHNLIRVENDPSIKNNKLNVGNNKTCDDTKGTTGHAPKFWEGPS